MFERYTVKQYCNIGRNLRYLRIKHGLTMKQLSDKLNIPRGSIGTYESYGNTSPERLKVFCEFYGVDQEMMLKEHTYFVKEIESR